MSEMYDDPYQNSSYEDPYEKEAYDISVMDGDSKVDENENNRNKTRMSVMDVFEKIY